MSCTSTTSAHMQRMAGLGNQPTLTNRLHKYAFPFKVPHNGITRSLTRSLKYSHVDIQRKQTCLQPTLTGHRGAQLRFVITNAVKSETKGKPESGDNDSPFEQSLKSRRKKQKKPSVQDLQPDSIPSPPKLNSMPAEDRLESSAVLLLISLFVAIIGQGLFLAVSGFLPESWDQFAQNVVYKTFSPTVGFFLACSAAYGVWKSKQGGGKN